MKERTKRLAVMGLIITCVTSNTTSLVANAASIDGQMSVESEILMKTDEAKTDADAETTDETKNSTEVEGVEAPPEKAEATLETDAVDTTNVVDTPTTEQIPAVIAADGVEAVALPAITFATGITGTYSEDGTVLTITEATGCATYPTYSVSGTSASPLLGNSSIKEIVINAEDGGGKKVPPNMFHSMTALEKVTVNGTSASRGQISKQLFLDCTSLKSVVIEAQVTLIGEYSFRNCSSLPLTSIVTNGAPLNFSDLASIDATSFVGCKFEITADQAKVYAQQKPKSVSGTSSYRQAVFEDSLTINGDLTDLTNIQLSQSWLFYRCTVNGDVTFPASTFVATNEFGGATINGKVTINLDNQVPTKLQMNLKMICDDVVVHSENTQGLIVKVAQVPEITTGNVLFEGSFEEIYYNNPFDYRTRLPSVNVSVADETAKALAVFACSTKGVVNNGDLTAFKKIYLDYMTGAVADGYKASDGNTFVFSSSNSNNINKNLKIDKVAGYMVTSPPSSTKIGIHVDDLTVNIGGGVRDPMDSSNALTLAGRPLIISDIASLNMKYMLALKGETTGLSVEKLNIDESVVSTSGLYVENLHVTDLLALGESTIIDKDFGVRLKADAVVDNIYIFGSIAADATESTLPSTSTIYTNEGNTSVINYCKTYNKNYVVLDEEGQDAVVNGKLPSVKKQTIMHNVNSVGDAKFTVNLGSKTNVATGIDALIIGGKEVSKSNYSLVNGTVTINSSFMRTLKAGEISAVIKFNDKNATVSMDDLKFYLYEGESEVARPTIAAQTVVWNKTDGGDITFNVNMGKGDDAATGIDAVYIDNQNVTVGGVENGVVTIPEASLQAVGTGRKTVMVDFNDTNNTVDTTAIQLFVVQTGSDAEAPEPIQKITYEYYKDVKGTVMIPFKMNSATAITELKIGDTIVPAEHYKIESGALLISGDYLDTMDKGIYRILPRFNDAAQTVPSNLILALYDKYEDSLLPYLLQNKIEFKKEDLVLKMNMGQGGAKAKGVRYLVIDNLAVLPSGTTIPLSEAIDGVKAVRTADTVYKVDIAKNTITVDASFIESLNLDADEEHYIGAVFENADKTASLKRVVLTLPKADPPVDPDEPTPPVDPEEPTDPPVNPDEPTDPPVNPDEPTDPPVNPDEPTDPPVNPDEPPTDPPVNPDEPTDPPVNPDEPTPPVSPDETVDPSGGNKPSTITPDTSNQAVPFAVASTPKSVGAPETGDDQPVAPIAAMGITSLSVLLAALFRKMKK